MKKISRIVFLILMVTMLSSCYFSTPGSQWIGIDVYNDSPGFGFVFINLFVVGLGFQLGGPLGLGFCAFTEDAEISLGISQNIAYVPNIGIHIFPFLSAIFQRYKTFCMQILFIYIQFGI